MKRLFIALVLALAAWGIAEAKINLAALLKERDTVQLTIYNAADLTLVKENRMLTLKKGLNQLQFSWENTLIDPTSLEMIPKSRAGDVDILSLSFPSGSKNLGLFNIDSRISGKVPVEISYLTSGLSWRAFYMGTLSTDEMSMRLQGYIQLTNNSGVDYENAQTRVIVGQIHLLDEIATLARRQYPYGRPHPERVIGYDMDTGIRTRQMFEKATPEMMTNAAAAPKEIARESLSEYFLYTIEGEETLPDQWSKRLPSFDVSQIPVENLYQFEEERFGQSAVRFLMFKNDNEHKLGITPLPEGHLKVFRNLDETGHLNYEGHSYINYTPVEEKAKLNLGPVENVIVEPVLMKYETQNYMFFENGNISGWDEIRTFHIGVKNTREIPVTVDIYRNFPSTSWDLKIISDTMPYEKIDKDTVKFTVKIDGKSHKTFSYMLTTYHGSRSETR